MRDTRFAVSLDRSRFIADSVISLLERRSEPRWLATRECLQICYSSVRF